MPAARPTLRSLATEAGVSPMTVSLALRNSREVSAATRRRIQRLATAHGYRPDPTITRLMHHLRLRAPARFQSTIAGLVETQSQHRRVVGGYLERLNDGLKARAALLDYAYSTFSFDDCHSGAQLQRVLLSRGVEGVVILPLRRTTDLSRLLDWTAFSTVSATPSLSAPRFHSAMPNHYDNMLTACRALTQAGCRRIGFAISGDLNLHIKYRWAGGIAWQNHFGGTQPVSPLITQRPGTDLEIASFTVWLAQENPDAVITDATNIPALAAVLARLPRRTQPSMITMNWPNAVCVAGIDQRPEHIGAATIDVLAGLLIRGEKGVPAIPGSTMIGGQWVGGKLASKKPRPRRKD